MLQTYVTGFGWDMRMIDRGFLEVVAGSPLDRSFFVSLLRFLRAEAPQERAESIEGLLRFMPGMRGLCPSLEIYAPEPGLLIRTVTLNPMGREICFIGYNGGRRVSWNSETPSLVREMAQQLELPAEIWDFRCTSRGKEDHPYRSPVLGREVDVFFEGALA